MSHQLYNFIHVFGLVLVATGLGGFTFLVALGLHRDVQHKGLRISAIASHGMGMLLLLVAGMGMSARLGFSHTALPTFVWIKLALWLLIGASPTITKKMEGKAGVLFFVWPVVMLVAAATAIFRGA